MYFTFRFWGYKMLNAGRAKCVLFRQATQVGKRHYASNPKTKFAKNLRYKDGRQLALEHFEFCYKPIFRHRWPSIRLGLTSRSKTCALINNFGCDSSTTIGEFEEEGALDLITLLEESRARRLANEKTASDEKRLQKPMKEIDSQKESSADYNNLDENDSIEAIETRSASSLNDFVPPTKWITRDTVPESHKTDDTPLILDTWKAEDVEFVRPEEVVYPKHLRAFVFPIGDVSKFSDSTCDETTGVRSHQLMDAAALFPVLALDVRPNETILDLCAAPGVKTLALLQTLIPFDLVCNDITSVRLNLLRDNLRTYVQRGDDVYKRIRFVRAEASHLRSEHTNAYDKVLVDAPNTEDRLSLRMLDHEGNLFRRFLTPERLQLPDQQTEILMGGLRTLKRDGVLVYTTSSLSPSQNDEVVETALRRLKQDSKIDIEIGVCDLESMSRDFYDAQVLRFAVRQCRYGQLAIPFLPNNYGPVYTCKLKRVD